MTLLAAERGDGIRAAVDFAGGSILWDGNPQLRARMESAANNVKVPIFLLQAENDFNPAPTRTLDAVLTTAGKQHRAKVFPPYGKTHLSGHAGFCNKAQSVWGPDVAEFLRQELQPH